MKKETKELLLMIGNVVLIILMSAFMLHAMYVHIWAEAIFWLIVLNQKMKNMSTDIDNKIFVEKKVNERIQKIVEELKQNPYK